MSIGRKLARLGGVGPGGIPPSGAPSLRAPVGMPEQAAPEPASPDEHRWDAFRDALRSKGAREERRPARAAFEPMELPGESIATELGPLHRIEARHPLGAGHGQVSFGAMLELPRAAIARFALDASFADVDPRRLVFLDTETTGLAGGAGTVPFLVGVAYVEGEALRVEQWLLRRYGEEAPILARLEQVLAGASALVTYNGKSFDWPLLRTRYVMHRMRLPTLANHLDLVHGARRLLAGRLPSVRLVDVERELLGFTRHDDLEAALIPEVFQEFQRTGAHPDMPRVLRHHAMDLLAMPAMLARFAGYFAEAERPADPLDRLACARVASRGGHDAATRGFVDAMLTDAEGAVATEGALLRAKLSRRAGDVAAERAALEHAVEAASDDLQRVTALLALAKHLEHRARDPEAALERARQAHRLEPDEALAHRIARLERRLARSRA